MFILNQTLKEKKIEFYVIHAVDPILWKILLSYRSIFEKKVMSVEQEKKICR